MGASVEAIIWGVAGLLLAAWLIGYILGAGPWIHALLLSSVLLAVFDIMDKRRKGNGP